MRAIITGSTIVMLLAGTGGIRGFAQQDISLVAIVPSLDAPAEVIQADVVANKSGAVETVTVRIHNFSEEPVVAVGLEALLFDGDNVLRREVRYPTRPIPATEMYSVPRGALPPGATASVTLPLPDIEAISEWNVAVAVTEVHLVSRRWNADADDVRRQALDSVELLNRR